MGDTQNELGKFIRQIRKNNQMTLRVLEEKSGVSYSQLSKIERGESIPLKSNLDKISDALGGSYKNELYHFAGYMPDIEYLNNLKYGYQIDFEEMSQDYIYENAYKKLKEHRDSEHEETSHVSFDKEGYLLVYSTDFNDVMVHEKITRYKISDILNDIFDEELVQIRSLSKKTRISKLFEDWLNETIQNCTIEDQEMITEELKDFVHFKLYQLKNKE